MYGPCTYRMYYVNDTQMFYTVVGNTTGRGGTQNPGDLQAWNLPNPAVAPTKGWTFLSAMPMTVSGSILYGDDRIFVGGDEPLHSLHKRDNRADSLDNTTEWRP